MDSTYNLSCLLQHLTLIEVTSLKISYSSSLVSCANNNVAMSCMWQILYIEIIEIKIRHISSLIQ